MSAPPIVVRFTPDGAASVEAALVRTEQAVAKTAATAATQVGTVAKAGEQLGGKFAGSARQASFALETMARTGQVAGEGMRQLLNVGSDAAFMFGPAGLVVGAIATTGLAISELMNRAQKEAKAAQEKIIEDFRNFGRQIRDADIVSANSQASRFYEGDQYASTEAERLGLRRIRQELTELTQKYGASAPPMQRFQDLMEMGRFVGERYALAMQRLKVTLDEATDAQKRHQDELQRKASTPGLEEAEARLAQLAPSRRGMIGTITPQQRLALELPDLSQAFDGFKLPDLSERLRSALDPVLQVVADFNARLKALAQATAEIIGTALADGIATAVAKGDLAEGFRQATASLLAGLGSMMVQFGKIALLASLQQQAWLASFIGLIPTSGIAAGLAMIAIGGALQGLSGRLGNVAPRVAGGNDRAIGGGLGVPGTAAGDRIPVSLPRQPWESAAAGMGPVTPRDSFVFAGNVFGAKDPALPRYLYDAMIEGARRGFKLPAMAIEGA